MSQSTSEKRFNIGGFPVILTGTSPNGCEFTIESAAYKTQVNLGEFFGQSESELPHARLLNLLQRRLSKRGSFYFANHDGIITATPTDRQSGDTLVRFNDALEVLESLQKEIASPLDLRVRGRPFAQVAQNAAGDRYLAAIDELLQRDGLSLSDDERSRLRETILSVSAGRTR